MNNPPLEGNFKVLVTNRCVEAENSDEHNCIVSVMEMQSNCSRCAKVVIGEQS